MDKSDNKKNSNNSPNSPLRKQFMKSDNKSFSDWSRDWKNENKILELIFGARHERLKVGRILFCVAFSFVFAVLVTFELDYNSSIKLGETSTETIRAPFDFQVEDFEATSRRQKEEIEKIPVVLDYYPNTFENKIENLKKTFSKFRAKALASDLNEQDFYEKNKEEFYELLDQEIDARLFRWLYQEKFSPDIEAVLLEKLEDWSTKYMVDESQLRDGSKTGSASVRIIGNDGTVKGKEQSLSFDKIDKIVAYENLDAQLKLSKDFSKYDKKKISEILRSLKEPNLEVNKAAYTQRVSELKKKSIPVVIPVKKNHVIIQQGSIIQAQDVLLINEIKTRTQSLKKKSKALFICFMLSILLLSGLSLLKQKFKFSIPDAKQDFLVLFAISFFGLIVTKLFIFLFEGALYQKFGDEIMPDVVVLMSPFAMLFMLSALLVKSRPLIWLFASYFGVGLSFLGTDKFSFLIVAFVAGLVSLRSFSVCKSRKDFYFAGFTSGVFIGLTAVFIYSLELESFSSEGLMSLGFIFCASVLGGMLSSIFTVTFVPLFESIFDVMTDLKLLELSSLSHPLMKDLMVRAPGTYHHCMVVGSMVEAACNDIGVNGLLGKVMAYFHDVGKMEHASYFIENQRKGYNPHDNISPYLSKTIIISHVKDGVELISKHKLGRDILAGVKEHHGTTLISYFHRRAQAQVGEGEIVKEEDFRYPGPKPHFKESAILMLADSIEAAARTIDEPSPLKIKNLIESMVDAKFKDGQLEMCNITFSEITAIKEVFYKILIGVYHHRVDYPKGDEKKTKPNKESKSSRTLPLGPQTKNTND